MRILIIGYGNPSRRDDGVGLVIINGLRQRLGLSLLTDNDDGYGDLGQAVDTLFLQQLMPELAETLAAYDRVFFVDAHVGLYPEIVRRVVVTANADPAIVSHHVKPAALLEIAGRLYGRSPQAELVSVLGQDFNFGFALSPATAAGAAQVIGDLWQEVSAAL